MSYGLNGKPPAVAEGFLDFYFNYTGWSETNCQTDLVVLERVRCERGLTCDFWAKFEEKKFGQVEESRFLHCAAHKSVSSFGRNDGCWIWVEERATMVEIQVEKDWVRGMVVTFGIFRSGQNDG